MSNQSQSDPTAKPLSNPRNGVRLFREDDDEIVAIVNEIKRCNIKIDILDLVRECIHQGLPAVRERWEPIVEAAKKGQ